MSVSTGFGFDLSSLDRAIKNADESLKMLSKTGEATARQLNEAFNLAKNGNIKDFISVVDRLSTSLGKRGYNQAAQMIKEISVEATNSIDKVNRMATLMQNISDGGRSTAKNGIIESLKYQIDEAMSRLGVLNERLQYYTKGEGKKAVNANVVDTSALQQEANQLRVVIELLQRRLEHEQAVAAVKQRTNAITNQQARDSSWQEMERQRNKELQQQSINAKEANKAYEQAYNDRYKMYASMLDKIQREESKHQAKLDSQRRRENYQSYVTSYEGATRTSDKARTLAQETQAVKNLEAARARLSKTDTDYNNKLNELNKRIRTHNENIKRATAGAKDLEKAHSSLGSKIATVFSVQAIGNYINKLIQVRGEMELQQRSLQAILQDKDKANEVWQKTIDLAVKSPFRINQLVSYTKQLAAYRVEADKLYDTNKMLADISAGLGVDMQRLILAFGQVKAANFLRGTELRQFTEAGIPLLDELAKMYTKMEGSLVTAGDVFARISKRMVLFEDVEAVLEKMTQAGGTFYRMQEIQSETLRGQVLNLKDSIDIMLNSIGKENQGVIKFSVNAVKSLVDNYKAIIPILKAVIATFAMYKISTFAASEATLAYAASMNMAKVSATGFGGIWTAIRVGLHKLMSALGKTLTMMATNPVFLFVSALAAVALEANKIRKEFKEINKQYEDMRDQQAEITAKFYKTEGLEKQKEVLQELIEYAEKEYSIKVNLDIEPMSEEEVKDEVNNLRQQMLEANAFGESFQKELIKANYQTKWENGIRDLFLSPIVFEEGMMEDIEDMGDAYSSLNSVMLNKLAPTIDFLEQKTDKLNKEQLNALKSLKSGIGKFGDENEDIVEYFDRLRESYSILLTVPNAVHDNIKSELESYKDDYAEAETEFKTFIKRIDEDVKALTNEQKVIFLTAAVDDAQSEQEWSDFEKNQLLKWLEKEYKIKLIPEIVEEDNIIEAWQESYNELFWGKTGFRKIETKGTSQAQVIERLQGAYEGTADLLDRIKKAGEGSVLEGGAYEGTNLEKLKQDLIDIKAQLEWFGAEAKKDEDKEKAAVKILQKRINLLKEVNKKYLELEKTFDAATAKEKVMEAYADTFNEAFEGTGVDLNLYQIMTQTIVDAHQVGEDAGSALTEGMLSKIKELEASGTYIRTFSDSLVEQIKKHEGFSATAYQDGGGVWTQGYGETQGVERGKAWTREYAEQRLRLRLTNDYAAAVNRVLDANRDLIVTQEQYNALVDLAYQGGGGAVKNLVKYAKDTELGLAHIETIYNKVKATMGEEAAARFGETFVNSFKEAKTIQERMALLLQTMNLTIKGTINKEWYAGMQKRSDHRSSMFSGDLDVAQQLETVLVKIAGMDFTTTEGMVEALGKLKEIAEKEGPEAEKILSQAISGLEVEIGVRLKKEADKKLNDDIQALFDQYELTVDLKKLNLPKDMAKQLFDVDYLDLDALREAITKRQAEFVGTEQVEQYQKFLEKIDEMERKYIVERTKKYVEYLKRGMNERVQLKIEELKMLKELEESDEFTDEQKEQIRNQIRMDTQKKLDKASWSQFKSTEWYTMMFTDLETLGTQAIRNLQDELGELKDSLSHLDPSEVKEIVSQMEKLQEQLIARNPFEAFRQAKDDIRALGQTEEDVIGQLKAHEDNERMAQKMLDMLSEIENARATGSLTQLSGETLTYFRSLRDEVLAGNTNAFADARKTYEHILSQAQAGKALTSEQVKMFQDYRKSLQGIADYWGEIDSQVQNIVGSAVDIMDVYGVKESTKAIAEGVGNMSTLIMQAVQFGIQMKIAGVASNMALGVIGWIALALQAIATIITTIANVQNARIDEQLEKQAKIIEHQRDIYEQIEEKVEKAYDVAHLKQYNKEMERSIELEIQALEASIALERSRKNADQDQIDDWQKEIQEARDRLKESTQGMIEELGGIFDLTDFTKGFVDAWWDAMDEGKKGLDALGEHFNETMADMVKNQALYRGASLIMEQVQNAINKSLEGDFSIDQTEWQAIQEVARQANINLDEFLNGWRNMFGELTATPGAELSGLQKGIQGITEDTAQIIEAYLNSIRGYVSEQVAYTKRLYEMFDRMTIRNNGYGINVRLL